MFVMSAYLFAATTSAQAVGFERFPPLGLQSGEATILDASRLADKIRLEAVPLKWRELLGSDRVVYLGDMPLHRETKRYVSAVIGDFAAAGFTHLGVEGGDSLQPHLDRFCGGHDDGKTALGLERMAGPDVAASTIGLLRAACSAGFRFIALDSGDSGEIGMARRLAFVLERDPSARVLAFLRRHHVAKDAQPAALRRLGFSSRSYTFLTNGGEAALAAGSEGESVGQDRRYYLALDAAGLRSAPLLLPCPPAIAATGCLALPPVLDERVSGLAAR